MKLENQVCSRELSKRLREFGVKQQSLWYWNAPSEDNLESKWHITAAINIGIHEDEAGACSAFTVAELGEMLPSKEYGKIFKQKYPTGKVEHFCYINPNKEDELYIGADTEANARAKMLIYLLENNLMNDSIIGKIFIKNGTRKKFMVIDKYYSPYCVIESLQSLRYRYNEHRDILVTDLYKNFTEIPKNAN